MNQDNRKNAHQEIDHIFKELLPAHGMAERPAQVALSHKMLDAMLDGSIALCDAGTGIGKTYAYLVAGTVFLRCRAAVGLPFQPLLISTSSIALQNAVLNEYLPFLSAVLMAGQIIDHPLRAVVRKGKSHYVCDERLQRRLGAVDLGRKSPRAREALLSLRDHLDLDMAEHLSGYDRERVHVPQVCDCGQATTTICLPTPLTGKTACGPCWRTTEPSSSTRPTSSRRPPGRCSASPSRRGICGA